MSDITLTPDEPLGASSRQLRLVTTGLADTADLPRSKHPEALPCYGPCEACGTQVLVGMTSTGTRLALDTSIATDLVDWDHGEALPRLLESRGYPAHQCGGHP